MLKSPKTTEKIATGKEPWRDLSITKKCEICKKKYHPRKNGYQATSKYCSQQCARIGIRKKLF